MEMRTAVVGAIYRKSLRLSNEARRSYNLGEIVNLVTTDAATLQVQYGTVVLILSWVLVYISLGPY